MLWTAATNWTSLVISYMRDFIACSTWLKKYSIGASLGRYAERATSRWLVWSIRSWMASENERTNNVRRTCTGSLANIDVRNSRNISSVVPDTFRKRAWINPSDPTASINVHFWKWPYSPGFLINTPLYALPNPRLITPTPNPASSISINSRMCTFAMPIGRGAIPKETLTDELMRFKCLHCRGSHHFPGEFQQCFGPADILPTEQSNRAISEHKRSYFVGSWDRKDSMCRLRPLTFCITLFPVIGCAPWGKRFQRWIDLTLACASAGLAIMCRRLSTEYPRGPPRLGFQSTRRITCTGRSHPPNLNPFKLIFSSRRFISLWQWCRI